jgi:predicted dienelactone hydrolase
MSTPLRAFRAFVVGLAALLLAVSPAGAVGFAFGSAPNPDDQAIEIAIWYPSDATTTSQPLGPFTQDVALNGPVAGDALPLVLISHGTGGGAAMHYDTALALAEAGFVVVALNHTGDNVNDRKYSFTPRNFIDRPKHVSRVIDFMLNSWDGRDHIDAGRIGMFGHSAGGATALIVIGGNADFYLAMLFCRDHPDEWGCQQHNSEAASPTPADWTSPAEWHHDPRVLAAVVAAPAIGQTFTKIGLENVTAPVQLWRAENDRITPNRWYADIIKDALPRAPEDHFVPNAGHYDFLAPCNDALAKTAPEICESNAGFDRAAFHQEMNKAVVAFFKSRLTAP